METGIFTRLRSQGPQKGGTRAGSMMRCGYEIIAIDRLKYVAHRLAWFYVHGKWPPHEIDHINGDRADNRIVNLRQATTSQNLQNQRKAQVTSKTGLLGVSYNGSPHRERRWFARICVNQKTKVIGYFHTPEEAHAAYLEAKRKVHAFGML